VTTVIAGSGTSFAARSTDKEMADARTSRRRRPRRTGLTVAAALCAVLVPAFVTGCGSDDTTAGGSTTTAGKDFSGYTRQPVPSVQGVSLPAADGSTVTMSAQEPGGLRLVYFGYTSCPDVCPTTMSDLKRALATLPAEERAKVQVDMVSIDPARDTGAKLTDYVTTFIPDGTAVRTDDQVALRAAADAFGADYSVTTGADGEPEVKHTADLYAVDDAGNVVLIWPFGTTSKDLGKDLRRLLAGDRPAGATAAPPTSATPTSASSPSVSQGAPS